MAMCCAASDIKSCVIVIVEPYCWELTIIVFVGDGWMALVPAHLPHLRLLDLFCCDKVRDTYITKILAGLPVLVLIEKRGKTVRGRRNKQPEAEFSGIDPLCEGYYNGEYDYIRRRKNPHGMCLCGIEAHCVEHLCLKP
jgi:hypothetical protein